MSIWVNTLVQNEDRYLWFSVRSVIDYVDKILLWDTGSTDKTLEVINSLLSSYPSKIEFKEVGKVDINEFTDVRKQMLRATKSDWVMILDGDEVWWEDEIKKAVEIASGDLGEKNIETIVSPYINLVGDIYHYQHENAGEYKIKGHKGFLTIRFMNKSMIKGLKIDKPHGQQGFYDGDRNLIQDREENKMYFMRKPSYLHFTNLQRSSFRLEEVKVPKRGFKLKYEIGNKFPLNYYFPEVFFKPRPKIVKSVWRRMNNGVYMRSLIETPIKQIKRRLFVGKSGY